MSILSGFRKQKRYATDEKGRHQLISTWTHTDTVYDDEGKSLTEIIEDLPAADKKVQQTATDSTNANYEILFSESADNVTKSEEARKSSRLLYNPGTKKLSLAGSKLEVTGSNNGTTEVGGGSMTISRNNNLMEPQLSIYNEHSGGEALLRSNNIQIRDDYTSPTKVMEIQQEDIVLTGDTWDGTNTSLKTALANAGAKVLYGTSAPTSVQGEDGQLYVQLKTLDPYLDNFVVDYSASTQGGIDTELDISNLNECVIYINQYQMVADVETLVGQYEEEVDFQNFNFLEITDDLGDVVLELGTSTGSDDLFVRKRNASDKFILSVVDADATADAIDKIYIKDNGEWLPDNDSTIPSPTSEDVDKVLGATDVGEYGWIDNIRFLDSGASAEVYTDHISVNQTGYGGSSMTREQIQISNIMGSLIRMTSSDITLGGTWDGTNTSLKAAIAAASGGGTEAVYKTLAEYEALPTADKEDPTKIYFVINEGSKVSPTLDADDGNISVSSTDGNRAPWHAFSGTTRSDAAAHQYCWAPWGQNNGEWIAYSFSSQQQFSKVRFRTCQEGATADTTLKYYVEGSNDGTTWNNLLLNKEYESIVMPKADNTTSPIILNFVDFNFLLDTTLPTYSKIRVRVDKSIGYPYSYNRWDVANFDIYAANTSAIPMIYYKDVLYNPLVKELPDTLVADAGKALIVNSEGEWDKGNIPRTNSVQVPPVIFDNNKLMKIADMTGFPELEKVFVTSEEYTQLTTAQKQDLSKIYYVSPYKFHSFEDGKIIIRTNANANETKWYFNGFEVPSNGTYNVPSEMLSYFDSNQASNAYSDETSETNLGYIEFSSNVIYFQQGFWSGSWIVTGTPVWGVVSKNGGNNQQNTYSDPYDVETPILIYYGGKQYTDYTMPSVYRELTQQEYDALPSSKNSDGIIYFITDNS